MIAMANNRAGKNVKANAWENADGEFGVAITDDDPNDRSAMAKAYVMTIEHSPEALIELAKDLLVLGLRKQAEAKRADEGMMRG